MKKVTILFCAVGLSMLSTAVSAQDSIQEKRISGNVMTEVNFGYRHNLEHPTFIDFPHIVVGGQWQMDPYKVFHNE